MKLQKAKILKFRPKKPAEEKMRDAAEIVRFIVPGLAFLQKEAAAQGFKEVAETLDKALDEICSFVMENMTSDGSTSSEEFPQHKDWQSIKECIILLGKMKENDGTLDQFLALLDPGATLSKKSH